MAVISPATLDDLPQLVKLENSLFTGDRLSGRQFRYMLTRANSAVIKAELSNNVIGYMLLLKRKNSCNLRIYSIGVDATARKLGIARSLLCYAEQAAVEHRRPLLTLEVCEHNRPAVQLYESAGFSLYGRKTDYYEDGCSALLFDKKISLPEL